MTFLNWTHSYKTLLLQHIHFHTIISKATSFIFVTEKGQFLIEQRNLSALYQEKEQKLKIIISD